MGAVWRRVEASWSLDVVTGMTVLYKLLDAGLDPTPDKDGVDESSCCMYPWVMEVVELLNHTVTKRGRHDDVQLPGGHVASWCGG